MKSKQRQLLWVSVNIIVITGIIFAAFLWSEYRINRALPVTDDCCATEVVESLLPAPEADSVAVRESVESAPPRPVARMDVFNLKGISPSEGESRIEVRLAHDPDIREAASFITTEPETQFRVEQSDYWWSRKYLSLHGDFEPGQIYKVTFKKGFGGKACEPLSRDIVISVAMPDRQSTLKFADNGRYLSPRGSLEVKVRAVNTASCKAVLTRVLDNNTVFFGLREEQKLPNSWTWDSAAAAQGLSEYLGFKEYRLEGVPNQAQVFNVALRDIMPETGPGIYLLTLESPSTSAAGRIVVVSDLGLSVRIGNQTAAVQVTGIASGLPREGVNLTLWSDINRNLGTACTDADGLALLEWRPEDGPFAITASLGADQTCLPLNEAHRVAFQESGGTRDFSNYGHEALVTTDRGIYRPGEEIQAHVLVRDRNLAAPLPFPVVLRLKKPDGRAITEWGAKLDEYGALSHNFILPDSSPTGSYALEACLPGKKAVVLGTAQIRIEDFAPPQLAVNLTGVEDVTELTEHRIQVEAAYLFGRPAAYLNVEASVTFDEVLFQPAGWQGWNFGVTRSSFAPLTLPLGSGKLDEEGKAVFTITPVGGWQPSTMLRERVTGRVRDGAGRVISTVAEGRRHVYSQYFALRANPGTELETGQTLTAEIALVLPDGSRVEPDASLQATAEIVREVWRPVIREDKNGRLLYRTVCEDVPYESDIPVNFEGKAASFATSLKTAGNYRVIVRAPDDRTATASLALTVSEPGMRWWSWGGTRPDALELTWDKAGYQPGDMAKLKIKSPFSGTMHLSVENRDILLHKSVAMTNNVHEISLQVAESFLPHVRCAVSVIRPAKAGEPWQAHRASGAVGLPLEAPGRSLKLSCSVPETARPGEKVTAKIRLLEIPEGWEGGQAVVAAVDEGILRLTDFELQDPTGWFLAPRRSKVRGFDLFNQLLPEYEKTLPGSESHTAGDEALEDLLSGHLSPVRSRRFKPVALRLGVMELDRQGIGSAVLELPEFAGKLRFMVLAYDRDHAGVCSTGMVVKRPCLVSVGLPRFLAPGDQCLMNVELFNESDTKLDARVEVSVEGPLSLENALPWETELGTGAMGAFQLRLKADGAIGVAKVAVRVEAGGESFSSMTELPIRPASGRTFRLLPGSVPVGESLSMEIPGEYAPGTLSWRLSVSGQPDIQLEGALQELLDYPYGCLEQTISRALPLLYLPELAQRVLPERVTRESTEQLVNSAVAHVMAMRRPNGSFTMWPGSLSRDDWDWGTLYAAQFLTAAGRAGYPVPDAELEVSLDKVREILNRASDSSETASSVWRENMSLKAQALATLAGAGRVPSGWLDRMKEQSHLMQRAAAAQIAAACVLAGEPASARKILDFLGVPGSETRDGFNSEARTLALTLLAWCEIEPASPVAVEIVRRLNGLKTRAGWNTTQDNALALLALGRYAALTPGTENTFNAQIRIGETEVSVSEKNPLIWKSGDEAVSAVCITNEGPAQCYYSLSVEGVPLAPDFAETSASLRIKREVFLDFPSVPMPETLNPGDSVTVRLTLISDRTREHLIVTDLLPAGLEVESVTIGDRSSPDFMQGIREDRNICWDWLLHREVRDDRLVLFSGSVNEGVETVFYYRLGAVTPGSWVWPPVTVEGMYEPEARASSDHRAIRIE